MNIIFSNFYNRVSDQGSRPALIDGELHRQLSYDELARTIGAFGSVLHSFGVKPGETVTIITSSSFQQAVSIIACLFNGVIASPLSPVLPENLMAEFISHASPALILGDEPGLLRSEATQGRKVLLFENAFAGSGEIVKPHHHAEDGGLLIYTSGTTGTAKGVLLSPSHIEANVTTAAAAFGYGNEWTTGCLLPLYHTFGLISDILPMLMVGGTAMILPTFEMRHARATVEGFRRYGVNSYSAPPVIFEAFMALNCLTDTQLRFAIAGAAPLHESTRVEYQRRFGHPIIPCYGLSEGTCFVTISPLAAIRPGSVGKAAGIDISVLDEQGAAAACDEVGEIAIRGRSVISEGYYRSAHGSAHAFSSGGWFLTGDLGRIDSEGYVYVTGRRKNMVIRGGEKVYLEDVDRILVQYPGVTDSASMVMTESGQADRAICFVVPERTGALTRDSLAGYIRKHLGPKHVPDYLIFTDLIPRTPTGKPKHVQLRALYESMKQHDH